MVEVMLTKKEMVKKIRTELGHLEQAQWQQYSQTHETYALGAARAYSRAAKIVSQYVKDKEVTWI
jgi:hypothetical protein